MRHVLFVDDEPQVLGGLRRMLRPRVDEWEMSFADSGDAALATLASAPFDVIVTDMRMPGMDGATLLEQVRDRWPDVVRIVLSGHSEPTMAMRSARVAHQFLTKPCDAAQLTSTVERACTVQGELRSPQLRQVVGEISTLPSPPDVAVRLQELLATSEPSLDAVAALVATDPALSAKILQLVNSAFFGLGQRLTSVRDAVSYLGINVLSKLALALSAFDAVGGGAVPGSFLLAEQAHALRHAGLVRDLLPDGPLAHDAFIVGLLHDIGILVLVSGLPDEHRRARHLAIDEGLELSEAERHVFGTSHAEVGAHLMSLWGLPVEIVEAVAMHHRAPELPHRSLDLLHAAHVAEALESEASARPRLGGRAMAPLDPDYVEALGLTDAVERARARIRTS